MKTLTRTFAAAATIATLAGPALAEQYIVALSEPIDAAHAPVLDTLKVTVVDAFDHDGQSFAILDAPGDAWLETLFSVLPNRPTSLATLPVAWTDKAMAEIDTATRLKFGTAMACGFCS